ncbi:MAG: response regulator, partial [Planctomycetes bacterium]|nr:response regulator [Planctomycetota bacterium]
MSRILVVDDEEETCRFLEEFLRSKGYEVYVATTSETALHLVKSERPHLVLLDINLPGQDGISILSEIKRIDREIGVIMVTAVKEEEIAKKAMQCGADGYI